MREGLQKVVPTDDTIVAIATPNGRSGIGVVRISGNQSESIAARFFKAKTSLVHRQSTAGHWTDATENVIDEVVATLFKAPHTYTGEDVLEISAHGNPLILTRIVAGVLALGVRIASPGEFTLRAVMNGKMDLIQAEAVRIFIDAQTDEQARTALLQMAGGLSKRLLPAKEKLVDIIARMEAGIDFADDDVAPPNAAVIAEKVVEICEALKELQQSYSYGRILFTGLRLAIVGKPNVGKSSLFNRFVGTDRAIVTSIPGTTRDVVSESVSLDGVPLTFFDTAGLRETEELVERIGVERTVETLSEADLALFVIDGSAAIDDLDRNILSRIEKMPHITITNKCDLTQVATMDLPGETTLIRISAKTGEGFENLQNAIRVFLRTRPESGSGPILTSARQFESISAAIAALDKGRVSLLEDTPHEMVLLDAYEALSHLNELTGEVVTEDILGRIFSSFCVGK
jgi:tRNA modification GTPase